MTGVLWGAPLWLAAAAAILLPILLHLFSRGRSRRVLVGAISWLRPAEALRGRRLRPSEPGLLALRAAALLTLAVALAQPSCPRPPAAGGRVVALVDPAAARLVARGDETARRRWRSFLDAGARESEAASSLRWLTPGLPPVDIAEVVEVEDPAGPQPPPGGAGSREVLSLLLEADRAERSPATRLRVFAAPRLSWFGEAQRPALRHDVEWTIVDEDRENRWPERATRRPDGAIRVVEGLGDRRAVVFTRRDLPPPDPREKPSVRPPRAPADAVPEDDEVAAPEGGPLRVAWIAPNSPSASAVSADLLLAERQVVAAALDTAADALGLDLLPVEVAGPVDGPAGGEADVVVVLGRGSFAAAGTVASWVRDEVRAGRVVFWQESNLAAAWLPCDGVVRSTLGGVTRAEPLRRCPPGPGPGSDPGSDPASNPQGGIAAGVEVLAEVVASGDRLLERHRMGSGSVWVSRWPLEPTISDRALSEDWPRLLAEVLLDAARRAGRVTTSVLPESDRRTVDPRHLPAVGPAVSAADAGTDASERDPVATVAAWFLLVVLLVAERLLATRSPRRDGETA